MSGERSSRDNSGGEVSSSSLRKLLRAHVVMFSTVLSNGAKGIKMVGGLGLFRGQGSQYMVEVGSYLLNLSYQVLVSPSQFHLHVFNGR